MPRRYINTDYYYASKWFILTQRTQNLEFFNFKGVTHNSFLRPEIMRSDCDDLPAVACMADLMSNKSKNPVS